MLQVYGCDDPRSAPGALRLPATVAMMFIESVLCVYSRIENRDGEEMFWAVVMISAAKLEQLAGFRN